MFLKRKINLEFVLLLVIFATILEHLLKISKKVEDL